MIGVVAVTQVHPGKEGDLETVMSELAARVLEEEAGAIYCDFFKHSQTEGVYTMLEKYESEEAFKLHSESAHFQAVLAQLQHLLIGPPEVHILQQIA